MLLLAIVEPSSTAANGLTLEIEIGRPIRAGTVSSIVLNTGDRTSIRLFAQREGLISATLKQHDLCAHRRDRSYPMPILRADDVLTSDLSENQGESTLASDFEVRPLPDFAACPSGSTDAWIRQSPLSAAGPWSLLRGIDCWASPMLSPSSSDKEPPSSCADTPVAAPATAFKLFASKNVLASVTDQWLLRRSRCVIRDTGLLLEDGALLTTSGVPVASYQAVRLLTPRLNTGEGNSDYGPNTLFRHGKAISNLEPD